MRIEFLVEDQSGGLLINEVMKKYNEELIQNNHELINYNIKSYKGIGGLNKGKNADIIKSAQLLNELPKRLLAIQNQYRYYSEYVVVFIVVDNDKRKTDEFYKELQDINVKYNITINHVFCIAIEEMEAWLLGDYNAIVAAYPEVEDRIRTKHANYIQDSICNTWEFLADILTPKGFNEFKKKNITAYDIGKNKIEWANKIGSKMTIRNNKSTSFNMFLNEIDFHNQNSTNFIIE